MTCADRIRAYRARQKEAGRVDSSRARAREHKRFARRAKIMAAQKPFTGCDGEGCGVDNVGRQLYMLFRMGKRELFTGRPLSTCELLDFICDHSCNDILVGFSFGYDVTMILRDLSENQQRRLFQPKSFDEGKSPFVWYKDFDIDYLPRNYFRVARVRVRRWPDGTETRERIKGTTRTIYETFGFYQKSFLRAIKEFKIGAESERERIARNKMARSSFESIDQEVRDYCALECNYLAQLMEKLREYCYAAGIVPKSWNGAGKLASALHKLHGTMERQQIEMLVPKGVLEYASAAYYGGRFEITRTGKIEDKVYEYDIRSAYPDAMRSLPCLQHGTWEQARGKVLRNHPGIFVASVSFRCDPIDGGLGQLGGLPVRSTKGNLYWPLHGAGIYWDCEIRSAERLGYKCIYKNGWIYKSSCSCRSFDWVEELYDYRRSIGSSGPGYPIKLAINSLYGKLAQRVGNPKYSNLIWAGLITALTRSKLNVAILLASPRTDIVMLATDGIYSLSPLDLPVGERLGEFESAVMDGIFIVQPGLYWSPKKRDEARKSKSRGLSGSFFETVGMTENFEKVFAEANFDGENFPSVPVEVNNFVGLKIALSRGKPETAGRWNKETRVISFDYRSKRAEHRNNGTHIVTSIKPGYAGLTSVAHKQVVESGGYKPLDELRASLADQQDWIETSPPFED